MRHTIGIDLGTFNSSAAVAIDRDTIIVKSKGGRTPNAKNFPSFVQFDVAGNKLCVGGPAKNAKRLYPKLVVWGVKRLVGLSYQAAVDSGATRLFQYDIERGPGDGILIRVGNERFTPSHILEAILREIKEDAEDERLNPLFGRSFEEAVISVPAYYKAIRTAPIIEAAEQAGFKSVHTIAEPTAAAIPYGLQIDREATILTFDLGAGTLDVTVLQLVLEGDKLVCGELCTTGHEELGGIDMNELLTGHVLNKYRLSHLPPDQLSLLRDEVEDTKIRLSKTQTAKVHFPSHDITLNRSELEDVLSTVLTRCRGPIRMAIKQAGLEASAIDHVLLVGGPTHMPCVRGVVRDELALLGAREEVLAEVDAIEQRGFPAGVDPMECVCRGAALRAARVVIPACTSMSEGYGTTYGSHYDPIIKENSMYPIDGECSIVFTNPNAKTLTVELVAKRADPDKYADGVSAFRYELQAEFTMSVIPTGELHVIELGLSVSSDRKLTATLTEQSTGKQIKYQNPDVLKNELVDLVDDGNIPLFDPDASKAYRAKYNREQSAWTKRELEECVRIAMEVLTLAKGYDHELLQDRAKVLQKTVSAVSYTNPSDAAQLANDVREFLDLLRQPEIGVIKRADFHRYMDDLARISS